MSFLKKIDRNKILIGIAIIAIIVTGVLIYAKSNGGLSFSSLFGGNDKALGEKVVKYINDNGLAGSTASLVSVSRAEGLIKVKIKISGTEYDSYVTTNGNLFFPQGYELNPKEDKNATSTPDATVGQTAEEILASIKKSDKPMLEAFIVSRCPFGLQMQRMMADAIEKAPALAQSVKAVYIGNVSADGKTIEAMHGAEEAKENLRQICIREEQPTKYWPYVACQMKATGTETSCEKSTGVNSTMLNTCISTPSKGVAYAKKDFDAANALGATASPTLALNGAVVEEFTADNSPVFGSSRSSDEVKTAICKASTTEPSFCTQTLNTAQAATSFSATYEAAAGGSTGAADCGS